MGVAVGVLLALCSPVSAQFDGREFVNSGVDDRLPMGFLAGRPRVHR
jgi:hypothetical protein